MSNHRLRNQPIEPPSKTALAEPKEDATTASVSATATAASIFKERLQQELTEEDLDALERQEPVTRVQLDALVLMKLVKHGRDAMPAVATGQLLGLDVEGCLEVTHAYPMPTPQVSTAEEVDEEKEGATQQQTFIDTGMDSAEFQVEMMRHLRDIHVDHNAVGWYTTLSIGQSAVTQALIELQCHYQMNLPQSIVLVYDPWRSEQQGHVSLRAFCLSPAFVELFQNKQFTPQAMTAAQIHAQNVLIELPVTVRHGLLSRALLLELDAAASAMGQPRDLDPYLMPLEVVSGSTVLTRQLQAWTETMDDYGHAQMRYSGHVKAYQKQQASMNTFLAKKRAEGLDETAAQAALQSTYRPMPAPSRLETLLVSQRLSQQCKDAENMATVCWTVQQTVQALSHP